MSMSDDEYNAGVRATAAIDAGVSLDNLLVDCPACGARELRAEVREEWRRITDVAHALGFTRQEVIDSGAKTDNHGRIHCSIPYAHCMACGLDADMSAR